MLNKMCIQLLDQANHLRQKKVFPPLSFSYVAFGELHLSSYGIHQEIITLSKGHGKMPVAEKP